MADQEMDETMDAEDGPPSAAALAELVSGQLFAERYEVQALVGRGGMGVVYRVRDRKLDDVVALKLLTLSTGRAVERFLREVRLARRVTHRNVARTHDLGQHGDLHFLTMEYVRGLSLDDVLEQRGKLEPLEAVKIADQIAAGLESAHAAGVIHRDLKPANVLIGEDGRVVLTDFGIARAARADTRTHETGALVGTPHYMSPEQITASAVDARSDVYALGLILFELVTGRLPFEADNALAVAVMRLHQPPLDPRTFAAIPDALAEIILRCLAREPNARPQSAGDARAMMQALLPATSRRAGAESTGSSSASGITPTGASLYAPMSPGRRAVAVLPFVYRGAAEHDYLGEGLAEELIDVLSRTKGLRVLALGATRRFADARDPARMGEELGADAVIDGTVQLSGERVRIAARLVDTDSGMQRWSERFDGPFEDVFTLQESMGRRIAESLRLQIDAAAHRHTAPPEAIELYLRARRVLRNDMMIRANDALSMLERCLELAPGFSPALPAHAMASVRAWWSASGSDSIARAERARASVARAWELAPDIAETHLVRGTLALQDGECREAAQAFAKALEIAPTMAEAHLRLGDLQVEAGRFKEGTRRLELALSLDPSVNACRNALARTAALEHDFERAERLLLVIEESLDTPAVPVISSRLRYALWARDAARVRRVMDVLAEMPGEFAPQLMMLARVGLREIPVDAARETIEGLPRVLHNARFTSLTQQLSIEAFAAGGAHEAALSLLTRSASAILIDVAWLARCPLFEPLRGHEEFLRAEAIVSRRAASIWQR